MNTSDLKSFIVDLTSFMLQNGYVSKPLPKCRLSMEEQTDSPIEARTGNYSPQTGQITLYVNGRHPKDILRTLAHELIHVQQDHEGRLEGYDPDNPIAEDQTLREIESEAFLKGNLALRDWTETQTHRR